MRFRYIYSACIVIETEDCKVLCDPWFYPAYEGSWVQWPQIEDPLTVCGPADFVYISHIHPDHYDPRFLKEYLAKYPAAKVVIAKQEPALLDRKRQARGVNPIVGQIRCGDTIIAPEPNANGIDSALLIKRGKVAVINMNDNPFDSTQVDRINQHCPASGWTAVGCFPFVGAGPWPQAYKFDYIDHKQAAADKKKDQFLRLFSRYVQAFQPTVAVPFAGQYWLHADKL